MLQLSRQARLVEVATDKTFLRELKEVYDAFQKYLARKDTYGKNGRRRGPAKTGRLFLGRIRIPRIDPELFRRSRHSLRRSLQVSQRPRSEFCRHRLALSTRIFQTGNRQGRHPARRQSQSEFSSSADPGSAARRSRTARFRPDSGSRCVRADLGASGRSHQSLPARYRYPGEQRGRSTHHRRALRRRSRNANAPGDRARHWRRERA